MIWEREIIGEKPIHRRLCLNPEDLEQLTGWERIEELRMTPTKAPNQGCLQGQSVIY